MTKTQALYKFMNGFGLNAYPSNAIPQNAVLPFMTFTKGFSRDGYSSTIHIYYHTESETVPDNKADQICDYIGDGGIQIPCDNGQLWITLESPKWYATEDEEDQSLKHRIVNISICDYTL